MFLRDWLQPPRQLMVVGLATAMLTVVALGVLSWRLLAQDAALERQRQQEVLEQHADHAMVSLREAVSDLEALVVTSPTRDVTLPAGVSLIAIESGRVVALPEGSVPYVPVSPWADKAESPVFSTGERLEFIQRDLKAAAAEYARVAGTADADVKAGALARLAGVHRKRHDTERALEAYDALAGLDPAGVTGFPAGLVARLGRASTFEEAHRTADLLTEATQLRDDLLRARWPLVKVQYETYSAMSAQWLGTKWPSDTASLLRAAVLNWLWSNRASLPADGARTMGADNDAVLLIWRTTGADLRAVLAGSDVLAKLGADSAGRGAQWGFIDNDGGLIAGTLPPERDVVVRTAAQGRLPWTTHVFAEPGVAADSPRRPLLLLLLGTVGVALGAAWYFSARAITQERQAVQLQADFVSAVSHEFRSPLTSVAHVAEMLAQNRFASADVQRRSYDVLVRDADRLRRLVEGLLEFRRFESGANPLRMESVDLSDLVRTTIADFQARVLADGYSIELRTPPASILTMGDRDALTRALWNLLDNAVKYSPEHRTVWVDLERRGDNILLAVRDQGIGIPADEHRAIFTRFVRGTESKTRHIKGTGIGLALVQHIVRAHGGDVSVDSDQGQGSTFTVILPVHGLQTSGSNADASEARSL